LSFAFCLLSFFIPNVFVFFTELVSPSHLDNAKRKEWHEMAEKFGMTSKSMGEGSSRVVVVTKKGGSNGIVYTHNNNNNNNSNNSSSDKVASSDRDWKDNYYRKRFHNRGLDDR
jgi:hypothetical protein